MNTFYNMIEHSLCYEEGDIHPKYITMWATHYAFQNDPTECQLFFEGLKAGVLDYTKKNNIPLNDKEKELTQHPQYNLNIFTISFSKQEDDLTMWRGYGQNGDGISLGFDFSKLPSTLPMYGADCKERKYWSESEPTYLLYPKSVIRISLCRTTQRNPNDRFGLKCSFVLLVLLVISNGSLNVFLYCLCAERRTGASVYVCAFGELLSL